MQTPTARNLHDYEQSLETTSLVVKHFRPWMRYIQWRFLDDGGEDVVLGRPGWLFYRQSVRYAVERQTGNHQGEAADPLTAIRSFRDQLQAQGYPAVGRACARTRRASIPGCSPGGRKRWKSLICEPTRRLFDQFDQCGIEYVDLFEVFRRARKGESRSDRGQLYLAQDSHWSPVGVRLAAAAVARRVLDGGTVHRGDHAYVERSITVRRHGDLVQTLQSPQIERALEPESLACPQVVQSDIRTPYRDAPGSELLILGDSFLRIFEQDEPGAAGFIAHLARELGQPLMSIVNDGGASTLVRQALARRPALLMNKKVVIWEFAEREIRFGTEGWQIVPLSRSSTTSR